MSRLDWSDSPRDLLVATKDGDWGKSADAVSPRYQVIRGTDLRVRVGDVTTVPVRHLPDRRPPAHAAGKRHLIETAGTSDRPTGRTSC